MTKNRDPFAKREALNYERPIPSREFIMQHLKRVGKPLSFDEVASALKLRDSQDRKALGRRLRAMERDGQILRNRRGGYGLIDSMQLSRGRVIGHKDGFGFVETEDAGGDIYLNAKEMRALLEGDRVLVRVNRVDRNGRREGEVVEILERGITTLVGRYILERGMGSVIPENKRISNDILIPTPHPDAMSGDIVEVEITAYPTTRKQALGKVINVLGEHMAPGMEIDIAIHIHDLPHEWPAAVKRECKKIPNKVLPQHKRGRIDLRELPLVTIDGEDARDFDDAVYCERRRGGWRLYVAIADVSYYVKPDSALDDEAEQRGNSVYFPGRVIPMLPEVLSNELCSLKPHCDRLCMVAEMEISRAGRVTSYEFYPGIMHSQARLTYTEVAAAIGPDKEISPNIEPVLPEIEDLYALYHVLVKARKKRGAIEFETVETKIQFGENRKIQKIVPVVRNDAHRIIEECMLLANVSAAQYLLHSEIPILYRVHESPPTDKVIDLKSFLGEFGLQLPGDKKPKPKDYVQILEQVRGRPEYHLIQTVMLRSLSQAQYSPENIGHFGLAFSEYTHFTSPIRRYSDLLVHRAIRHLIAEKPVKQFRYTMSEMTDLGAHLSATDRRAEIASRDAIAWLKCEFMMDKVGEEFEGIVTGVTGFGMFVELTSFFVEGLVHISALGNDYYHFNALRHRLQGERSGTQFCLGDKVRVLVTRVDIDDRQIDFDLVRSYRKTRKKRKS